MKVFCFMLNSEPSESIKLVKVVPENFIIFPSKDLSSFKRVGECFYKISMEEKM